MADLTTGISQDAFPLKGTNRVFVQYRELDTAAYNLAASGTYTLFNLPANSLVLCVAYQVVTAEGGTATFDLGDSGSATRFYSNADANATAGTKVGSYVTPLFYGTANSVILSADHAMDAAKLRFWVVTVDMNVS